MSTINLNNNILNNCVVGDNGHMYIAKDWDWNKIEEYFEKKIKDNYFGQNNQTAVKNAYDASRKKDKNLLSEAIRKIPDFLTQLTSDIAAAGIVGTLSNIIK